MPPRIADIDWPLPPETPTARWRAWGSAAMARVHAIRDDYRHRLYAPADTWTPPAPVPASTIWPFRLSRADADTVAGWTTAEAVRTGWPQLPITSQTLPEVAYALRYCSPAFARWLVCQHAGTLPVLFRNPAVTPAVRTTAFAALIAAEAKYLDEVDGWNTPPHALTLASTLLPILETETLCPGHFPWTAAWTDAVTHAAFPPFGAGAELDLVEALAQCPTTPVRILQAVGCWAVQSHTGSRVIATALGAMLHNLLVHPKTQAGRPALRRLMQSQLPSRIFAPYVFPLLPEVDQRALRDGLLAAHGAWASVALLAGAPAVRAHLRPDDLTAALTGPVPAARLAAIQLLAAMDAPPSTSSVAPGDGGVSATDRTPTIPGPPVRVDRPLRSAPRP